MCIGTLGPVILFGVPPIRRAMGIERRPQIPLTYPSMFVVQTGGRGLSKTYQADERILCSSVRTETESGRLRG
jgi:hypothetical protein